MHVVFVQNGDFRAAHDRLAAGGGETFHAQEYSVNYVRQLAVAGTATTVISVTAEQVYDTMLGSGVRAIGLENIWHQPAPDRAVLPFLEACAPTHLILRYPSVELLSWARWRGIEVLPSFADSFALRDGLRKWVDRWRLRRLAAALNHHSIRYLGNHNIAACEALADIGVEAGKIIPWDWPRTPTPSAFPTKQRPNAGPKKLIFVGAISEAKGVGDILRALAVTPIVPQDTTLEVYGRGDTSDMQALAHSLGVAERVHFGGVIAHSEVAPAMHAADAVLVYSRHSYSEGLPGTMFLGLAARTPLIVSDHPVFLSYVSDATDAVIVPERAPEKLARAIAALFENETRYAALSENSDTVFQRMTHPVLWADFVDHWLNNSPQDQAWLAAQSLPNWRTKPTSAR